MGPTGFFTLTAEVRRSFLQHLEGFFETQIFKKGNLSSEEKTLGSFFSYYRT